MFEVIKLIARARRDTYPWVETDKARAIQENWISVGIGLDDRLSSLLRRLFYGYFKPG